MVPGPDRAGPSVGDGPMLSLAAARRSEAFDIGVAIGRRDSGGPRPAVRPDPALRNLDREVQVGRGDTLLGVLTGNGVERTDAHAVIAALRPVFDPRRLQIGQTLTLEFGPEAQGDGGRDLLRLSFRPEPDRDVLVRLTDGKGFQGESIDRVLERTEAFAAGRIDSSLYEAAVGGGMPVDVLMQMIRVFSFDVDFQREVQPGDSFEVMFDRFVDDVGDPVREGDVRYAAMTLSGKTLEYYRYVPKGGPVDYFDPKGKSVRKTLMRTPVDGAQLTSAYGMRRHPVLGYSKMHRGVDFGAPPGAPIMAAGDGVIAEIGPNGSYGNYIKIRHNSTYKTLYLHLSRFAKGVSRGKRVTQGQVIGYVGATGNTTANHLHFEVHPGGGGPITPYPWTAAACGR